MQHRARGVDGEQQRGAGERDERADQHRRAEPEPQVEPARRRRRDRPADRHRREGEPGDDRRRCRAPPGRTAARTTSARAAAPRRRASVAIAAPTTRCRNTHNGSTGSAARRSTSTNATSTSTDPTSSPMLTGEAQAQITPPSSRADEQGDRAHEHEHRAEHVDLGPRALGVAGPGLLLEPAPQHPCRGGAEREVDEEDPAPRRVVGEHAAEGRADQRRDRPDGRRGSPARWRARRPSRCRRRSSCRPAARRRLPAPAGHGRR